MLLGQNLLLGSCLRPAPHSPLPAACGTVCDVPIISFRHHDLTGVQTLLTGSCLRPSVCPLPPVDKRCHDSRFLSPMAIVAGHSNCPPPVDLRISCAPCTNACKHQTHMTPLCRRTSPIGHQRRWCRGSAPINALAVACGQDRAVLAAGPATVLRKDARAACEHKRACAVPAGQRCPDLRAPISAVHW